MNVPQKSKYYGIKSNKINLISKTIKFIWKFNKKYMFEADLKNLLNNIDQ
jgi:hypothetical protein